MTRYEKMSTLDSLAKIINENSDYDYFCGESPLRINNECPVDENDIRDETCIKCIKAWLMEEVD